MSTLKNLQFDNIEPFLKSLGVRNSFCINLDDRSDRLGLSYHQFTKHNMKTKFYSAFNSKDLNIKSINSKFTPGMIGCFMSHYSLIRYAKINNLSKIAIFEDDLIIDDSISEILDDARKHLPEDWDVICLGWYFGDSKQKHKLVSPFWLKIDNWFGAHGYILSKRAINKLNQELKKMTHEFDIQISELGKIGELNIYNLAPQLIHQSGSESNVQPK